MVLMYSKCMGDFTRGKWITNLASDAGVIFIIQMLWQFMILELLKWWGLGAGHMIT